MSLIDSKLEFSANQDLAGVGTGGAFSENILDLGLEENHLSGNIHGAGYFNVAFVGDDFAPSSASVVVLLQHSDDGKSFSDVISYSVDPSTEHKMVAKLPNSLKRYLRLKYTPSASVTTGKVEAFIGAPLADH